MFTTEGATLSVVFIATLFMNRNSPLMMTRLLNITKYHNSGSHSYKPRYLHSDDFRYFKKYGYTFWFYTSDNQSICSGILVFVRVLINNLFPWIQHLLDALPHIKRAFCWTISYQWNPLLQTIYRLLGFRVSMMVEFYLAAKWQNQPLNFGKCSVRSRRVWTLRLECCQFGIWKMEILNLILILLIFFCFCCLRLSDTSSTATATAVWRL